MIPLIEIHLKWIDLFEIMLQYACFQENNMISMVNIHLKWIFLFYKVKICLFLMNMICYYTLI